MISRKLNLLTCGCKGRNFWLLVALVIIITGIINPKPIHAAENTDFSIVDGKLVKYTGSEKTVSIPDTVTIIGDSAFSCCKSVDKVIIPSSVILIERAAFNECTNLKDITIPKSVTAIEEDAFRDTPWLTDQRILNDFVIAGDGILISYAGDKTVVTIPSEVKKIGAYTFDLFGYYSEAEKKIYSKIKEVIIPDGVVEIGDCAFARCKNLQAINISKTVSRIGADAFYKTKWLSNNKSNMIILGDGVLYKYQGKEKKVTIPSSVKSISSNAFIHNNSITTITGGKNVTYIGTSAFYNCTSLKSFSFSNKLECIDDNAFSCCGKLKTVILPKTIKYIGNYVFRECKQLQSVKIDKNAQIDTIQEFIFCDCEKLSSISIPNAVHVIKAGAFVRCTNLKNLVLPNKLKTIENSVFWSCSSLSEISLPETLTYIGENAFSECVNLKKIRIPDKVKFYQKTEGIDDTFGIFMGCSKLKDVILPNELTEIPDHTFLNCSSLNEITIPKSVTSIGTSAFEGARNLEELNYEGTLNLLGGNAFKDTKWLNNITDDFAMFQKFLLIYKGKDSSVTIPDYVQHICDSAFSNNKVITEVKIPDTIESIGNSTFSECINLKSVTLPSGIESIGNDTFSQCINLKTITIPGNVESIGNSAFINCRNLESVILVEGIKHLNEHCFEGCEKLKSISFPNTLISIGARAFAHCKELNTVNFPKNKVDYAPFIFEDTKIYNEKKEAFIIAGDGTLLKYLGNSVEATIPSSVTTINHYAFTDESFTYENPVSAKKVLIVPGNIKEIPYNAFSNAPFETIVLEEGVTTIGDRAFQNSYHQAYLRNITIPSSVISIGKDVFDEDDEYGSVAPVITCKKDSIAYKEAMRLGLKINLTGENNEVK